MLCRSTKAPSMVRLLFSFRFTQLPPGTFQTVATAPPLVQLVTELVDAVLEFFAGLASAVRREQDAETGTDGNTGQQGQQRVTVFFAHRIIPLMCHRVIQA